MRVPDTGNPRPNQPHTQARLRLSRPRLPRRGLLAAATAGSLIGLIRPSVTQTISEGARQWAMFRDRYLMADGRIVDTGNAGVSHSEGQGIGLLAAARFDDRAAFDRMRDWTRVTLQRPFDALHAWRYRHGAEHPVDDLNNATDGDLLIALALLDGADRWGDPALRAEGIAIGRDVLRFLVRESAAGLVLLPGLRGFTHGPSTTVNLSYYVFPAIARMAEAVPSPLWARLRTDGLRLIQAARFGRWGLPADWIEAAPGVPMQPAPNWPARFSFDAVRIPLYLAWADMGRDPVVASIVRFWSEYDDAAVPAWVDVQQDDVAPYAQSTGMVAIRRYVEAMHGGAPPAGLPRVDAAPDYYAAALTLLTYVALEDRAPVES